MELRFRTGSYNDIVAVPVNKVKKQKTAKKEIGYVCSAKYGCGNTRKTHITFEIANDFVLCSDCMDAEGMELAKMMYMWNESYNYDDWWFCETSYYEKDDDNWSARVTNEQEWWGLQRDEKWVALFEMAIDIAVPPSHDICNYAECRWIIKGE